MKRLWSVLAIAALLLILPARDVAAQRFGIKGGLQWSEFRGETGDPNIEFQTRKSFSGGVYFRLRLVGIDLQPEILYSKRGAVVHDASLPPETATQTWELDYVEVPVLLHFGSAPTFFLGGYGAVRVNSRVVTGVLGEGGTELDISSSVENLDYGLVFGAGVQSGKLGLEARYTLGLRKLFIGQGGEAAPDTKHRALGLFASLSF